MANRLLYYTTLLFFVMFFGSASAEAPALKESEAECRYDIGTKTVVYFDKSRERPVITEFYYPAEQNLPPLAPTSNNFKLLHEQRDAPLPQLNKKQPLIIVSHAYQSNRQSLAWLQELLAANGYIVAAPDHYGCTSYIPRPEECVKHWERPRDITFLIEQILADDFFKQYVDPEKIGFIGYELGSLTGIWLAGGTANNYPDSPQNSELLSEIYKDIPPSVIQKTDFSKAKKSYKDKKIKALLLINPIYSSLFNKEGLTSIDIRTLIISSDGEIKDSLFFANNIQGGKLITIPATDTRKSSQLSHSEMIHEEQAEVASEAINFFNSQFTQKYTERDSKISFRQRESSHD